MASVTGTVIITDALLEIGKIQPGESLSADYGQMGLSRLNQIADDWTAEKVASYAQSFLTFTFVPSLTPHTIGPSVATFTVDERPVAIDSANVIQTTTNPSVRIPIVIRDWQWWDAQSTPDVETSYPTDLYYQPDYPNGKLFFWPVPSQAYDVELVMRLIQSTFTISGTTDLPPGYQRAYTMTLAEDLCGIFGEPMPEGLPKKAMLARNRIFSNNALTPTIRTQDSGMPTMGSPRPSFNYLTGLDNGRF